MPIHLTPKQLNAMMTENGLVVVRQADIDQLGYELAKLPLLSMPPTIKIQEAYTRLAEYP